MATTLPVLGTPVAGDQPPGARGRRSVLSAVLGGQGWLVWVAWAWLVLVLAACLAAPLYAAHVAHTGPDTNNLSATVLVRGEQVDVVSLDGVPVGPTWTPRFLLGADPNGRDEAVRLLYGGRTSLLIGVSATAATLVVATVLGVASGYLLGWVDALVSRLLDLIWAYPALLLGVALGVSLTLGGISLGPVTISSGSLVIPVLIIAVVFVPYVARPVRAQVLALRGREFVDAARVMGQSDLRIMATEVLPGVRSVLVVFASLQLAQSIILEASLSFLGAGVQAPASSWGTMLADGASAGLAAPHLLLVPGAALVSTVLAVYVIADSLRRAGDVRSGRA